MGFDYTMDLLRMRLLVALLLLTASPSFADIGIIPTNGLNFYCPHTPPAGVTCCEKKWIEKDNLPPTVGSLRQPLPVMECDNGEGFYVRIPYPTAAKASWSVRGLVASSDANAGQICFAIYNAVTPPFTGGTVSLDDAYGTDVAINVGILLATSTSGKDWAETRTHASGFKMFNSVDQVSCTDTSCDGGWITVYVKRGNISLCGDTKAGKAWVSEIDFYYQ